MDHLSINHQDFPPSLLKHVLGPEVARLEKAHELLPSLLMNAVVSLQKVAEATELSLTELRFGGWEDLFIYIRDLEAQIRNLRGELEAQDKRMRDLVLNIEENSQKIIKLYRENSSRSAND